MHSAYTRHIAPDVDGLTKYEKYFGRAPHARRLYPFGCFSYATLPLENRSSHGPRVESGIFLEYDPSTANGHFILRANNRVVTRFDTCITPHPEKFPGTAVETEVATQVSGFESPCVPILSVPELVPTYTSRAQRSLEGESSEASLDSLDLFGSGTPETQGEASLPLPARECKHDAPVGASLDSASNTVDNSDDMSDVQLHTSLVPSDESTLDEWLGVDFSINNEEEPASEDVGSCNISQHHL
jgi:hypothetical protein